MTAYSEDSLQKIVEAVGRVMKKSDAARNTTFRVAGPKLYPSLTILFVAAILLSLRPGWR